MKAVIWTDVIQASVMFLGLILSIVIGLIDLGGISKVYETVKNGNRLQFSVYDDLRDTISNLILNIF
jgi:Na+/proline symporter